MFPHSMNLSQSPFINIEVPQYSFPDKLIIKIPETSVVKNELRYATQYLTAHKLYHSAKWYLHLLFDHPLKTYSIGQENSCSVSLLLQNTK